MSFLGGSWIHHPDLMPALSTPLVFLGFFMSCSCVVYSFRMVRFGFTSPADSFSLFLSSYPQGLVDLASVQVPCHPDLAFSALE